MGLEKQFAQLVDTGFTAQMEGVLDDIAAGDLEAEPYLDRFYRGGEGIEARTRASLAEVDAKAISTLTFPKWGDLSCSKEFNILSENFFSLLSNNRRGLLGCVYDAFHYTDGGILKQ